jgi:hypothetical protein
MSLPLALFYYMHSGAKWQVNVALALACASFVFAVAQPVVFVGHRLTFITLAVMLLVNLAMELFVCLMALKNDWL